MKQDKKQKIVEAASKLFAEKGYEKASIKEIAKEAGITSGLVHYYFQNKEEVLSDVVLEASHQYTRDMQALKQAVPEGQLAESAMQATKERVQKHPDWYRLRYELFAIGLRNPHFAEKVNQIIDNGQSGISHLLTPMMPNAEEEDVAAVAAILLACFDGLALQKMLNPDFDIDRAYLVLEKMASSLQESE
ncbi:hypothetical protein T458_13260 [Brevibacillus panacihumi W25]|uniref:HTH tetR-type domain-containing protein n=1 Tax=Brevibacillus panacihumi W25 TaxID=1408254 RepID=V6MFX3_9BACL|nr:TetR/AcrR family transcriptional regulator [Brevibacillus panacihumi]EST54303.1 hypothetical protein T458_13260 [Brevibacillus panacihumi W25]